jgi:hypothetical protein
MHKNKLILKPNFDCTNDTNFILEKKENSFLYDSIFIEYQKEYKKNFFYKDISFKLTSNTKDELYFPITIEQKDNIRSFNFYGNPIILNNFKLNNSIQKDDVIEIINNILRDQKVEDFYCKKYFDIQDNYRDLVEKYESILESIVLENSINLENSLEDIKRGFSKGHKSALKKNFSNLIYEIFDCKNYKKNQIFEMQFLHETVSGKKTRSKNSWEINEKMVQAGLGILIKVSDKEKTLSYTLIYFNKFEALYFSSVTLREVFKLYNNITHKIIWKAVEYLKKKNRKVFHLGVCKTLFSKSNDDQKLRNIELFKSSFGGDKKLCATFNKISNFL